MNKQIIHALMDWDADNGIPVDGSDFYLSWDDRNLNQVVEMYGKKYAIRAVFGDSVDLEALRSDQMTCAGGKHYHFILTKKKEQ